MSRDIKFRAWDEEHLCMVERPFVVSRDGKAFDEYRGGGYVKKYLLMQFTGLHDKNGKEIYEGDILARHTPAVEPLPPEILKEIPPGTILNPSMVHGRDAQTTYTEVDIPGIYFIDQYNEVDDAEVVGNIYENPELLKK